MPCGYITIISVIYSQLARAKSKNLDNIYSSFKQHIKSYNAKRRRQRWRTVKNNNRSNKQKSNFARAAHFFLYISLPLLCPPPRGGLLPYMSYIKLGMCRPIGMGFAQFWSENGDTLCPLWSGIGAVVVFEGATGAYNSIFTSRYLSESNILRIY